MYVSFIDLRIFDGQPLFYITFILDLRNQKQSPEPFV
jgi:hypothetical protein